MHMSDVAHKHSKVRGLIAEFANHVDVDAGRQIEKTPKSTALGDFVFAQKFPRRLSPQELEHLLGMSD